MKSFKGSVTTIRAGKKYHIIFCPKCSNPSFLYPVDPLESRGFCECGHEEFFRVEKVTDLRKGKTCDK